MSSYTPGRWKVVRGRSISNGVHSIAAVHVPKNQPEDHPEIRANAQLMAAAPDLLEACHNAVNLLRGAGFVDTNPTLCKLIEAIRKATQ